MYTLYLKYQCPCEDREVLSVVLRLTDVATKEAFLVVASDAWEVAQREIVRHSAEAKQLQPHR